MGTIIKDYGFVVTHEEMKHWGASGSSRFGRIDAIADAAVAIAKAEAARIHRMEFEKERRRVYHETYLAPTAQNVAPPPRVYTMNVTKFRRKAIAYALLRRSMRFLAFYSVSFPKGMPDDVGFRIWNKVLTRLRKDFGLKSYLWVMERQKNGTLHYHMLTNDFMNVTEVNRITAVAIENEVHAGHCNWGKSSFEKYNGVDVEPVVKNRFALRPVSRHTIILRVVRYLSKYMSKDIRSESHRVWHCSRLVSALCTAAAVDECDMREIVEEADAAGRPVKIIQSSFATVIITAVIDSVAFRDTIIRINDEIYNYFEQHNLF